MRDTVVDNTLDEVLLLPKVAKIYDIYTTGSDEAELKYELHNKQYLLAPFSASRVLYDFLGQLPATGKFWSIGTPATSCLEAAVSWDLQTGAQIGAQLRKDLEKYTQQPPTTAPATQQSPTQFALTGSSPTSGPAGGGTLIVIGGSGLSSVNKVVMNPVRPGVYPTLHPNFSVVSASEIDVTTPAGVAGLTYEIDFFTPHDEYFTTTFSGIPLFTFK